MFFENFVPKPVEKFLLFKTAGEKPIKTTAQPTTKPVENATEPDPGNDMQVFIERVGHNSTELIIFSGDNILSCQLVVYQENDQGTDYMDWGYIDVHMDTGFTWTEISSLQSGINNN